MDGLKRELSLPVSEVARHAHYVVIIVQKSKIIGNMYAHFIFFKVRTKSEILLKSWEWSGKRALTASLGGCKTCTLRRAH